MINVCAIPSDVRPHFHHMPGTFQLIAIMWRSFYTIFVVICRVFILIGKTPYGMFSLLLPLLIISHYCCCCCTWFPRILDIVNSFHCSIHSTQTTKLYWMRAMIIVHVSCWWGRVIKHYFCVLPKELIVHSLCLENISVYHCTYDVQLKRHTFHANAFGSWKLCSYRNHSAQCFRIVSHSVTHQC